MYRTHGAVFRGLYLFPVAFRPYQDVDTLRNIMLVATAERGLTRVEILTRARQVASRVKYRQFLNYAGDYYDVPINLEGVSALTDDYAPVDTLVPLYRWSPVQNP